MSIVASYGTARRGMAGDGYMPGPSEQLEAAANAGILVTRLGTTNKNAVKAPATAAEVAAICGALIYDQSRPKKTATQTTDFAAGDIAEVVQLGPIVLHSETAQAKGTNPYVRYAAGAGGTELGVLRNAAVASETAQLTKIEILETTTAAGPVWCRINV